MGLGGRHHWPRPRPGGQLPLEMAGGDVVVEVDGVVARNRITCTRAAVVWVLSRSRQPGDVLRESKLEDVFGSAPLGR